MKTIYTTTKIKSIAFILLLILSKVCSSQTTTVKPIVRLVLDGYTGSHDMTTFYFEQGGSLSFQSNFDAYKLIFNTSQPYIASVSNTVLCSIKGMPVLNTNMVMPVKAITAATGSFTFSSLKTDFPNNVCVNLFDSFTGITTNILTTNYTCTLYDTTSTSRFKISFFTTPLSALSNVIQPNCIASGGVLTSKGNNNGPWNYEWRNSNNVIVKTSLNKSTADSLTLLQAGNYSVKINTVGQCDNYQQTFTINTISAPYANFSADSYTVDLASSGQVNFTNLSVNAQNSFWDFGDAIGISSTNDPVYNYTQAGIYSVKLIVQSNSMCTDTITKQVTVLNITGIKDELLNNNMLLLYDNVSGNYVLKFNSPVQSSLLFMLYDLNGKLIISKNIDTQAQSSLINTKALTNGVYLLKIISEEKEVKVFKILK